MSFPTKVPNVREIRNVLGEARVIAARCGDPILLKGSLTQFRGYWVEGEAGTFFDWWGSAASQVARERMGEDDGKDYIAACGTVARDGTQLAIVAGNLSSQDPTGLMQGIDNLYHCLERVVKYADKVDPHFKLV